MKLLAYLAVALALLLYLSLLPLGLYLVLHGAFASSWPSVAGGAVLLLLGRSVITGWLSAVRGQIDTANLTSAAERMAGLAALISEGRKGKKAN